MTQKKESSFPLPLSFEEAGKRGWSELDVILISGDAYVDHPSFGIALVGRYLESLGVRVGILAQPDINNDSSFKALGEPRWFFGISAGNLDSMMMRYTAQKRYRSDDAYTPGGKAGLRPERATIAYSKKLRQLYPNTPQLLGGIEASLRRFAHYDYWGNNVRPSILFDTKAELLLYGMAEQPLKAVINSMKEGKSLIESSFRLRGTARLISKEERKNLTENVQTIPSFEEVVKSKKKYAKASRFIHLNQNPASAKTLLQQHRKKYLCVEPPAFALTEKELDAIYALPFTRLPHPSYREKIPAFEMIRFSVTAMRGCFGGCSFCALTVHQGKAIQSRSSASIAKEVRQITQMPGFTGFISDIGGPTANMYKMHCSDPKAEAKCKRVSCIHPNICPLLNRSTTEQITMLKEARSQKGVKKVFIASGVRYDLANESEEYITELATHHVSGQLKVAPEHTDSKVLQAMRKPDIEQFEQFKETFLKASEKAGLKQFLLPYFIASHPGCSLKEQVNLASYMKKHHLRVRQVQDFIPAPLTLAGDAYYSGEDPITEKELFIPKEKRERELQRALMQYFKPEHKNDVREALQKAERLELIGKQKNCIVPHQQKGANSERDPQQKGRKKKRQKR